jgi:hypothetical protein
VLHEGFRERILAVWHERKTSWTLLRRNSRESSRAISKIYPPKMPARCAAKFMPWRSGLPAPQIAEKLHDLGKTRVLVLYPVPPQDRHKFSFIIITEDSAKIALERIRFSTGVLVLVGHLGALILLLHAAAVNDLYLYDNLPL